MTGVTKMIRMTSVNIGFTVMTRITGMTRMAGMTRMTGMTRDNIRGLGWLG